MTGEAGGVEREGAHDGRSYWRMGEMDSGFRRNDGYSKVSLRGGNGWV